MARRSRSLDSAQFDVRDELVEHLQMLERHRGGREYASGNGGVYRPPYSLWLALLGAGADVRLPVIYLPADARARLGLNGVRDRLVTITSNGVVVS